MAIFHSSTGFISRSTGGSSVASYGYITGERVFDERNGQWINYSKKNVYEFGTLSSSEKWLNEGSNFWNYVELYEDIYAETRFKSVKTIDAYKSCAQTAQKLILALPREISLEDSAKVIKEYAFNRFISRGLVVSYGMHADEGNPHVHLLISRRAVSNGELSWTKDREIVSKKELIESRKIWADLLNAKFVELGIKEKVDHRSYKDQGIEFEATIHEGWYGNYLGKNSKLVAENEEIIARNAQLVIKKPECILREVGAKLATFSRADLAKCVFKRVAGDEGAFAAAFEKINEYLFAAEAGESKVLSYVGVNVKGEKRYTLSEYREIEKEFFAIAERSVGKVSHKVKDKDIWLDIFSAEQQEAIKHLCDFNGSIKCVVGRAGVGKTKLLESVGMAYSDSRYRVTGLSLAGKAAAGLMAEAKIESRTIASWLMSSQNLTKKDVLVIDEAGMVDLKTFNAILSKADAVGAKVLCIGDPNQLGAINAGDAYRGLISKVGACDVLEVRRQTEEWMREASKEFGKLNIKAGLYQYATRNKVKWFETLKERNIALANRYVHGIYKEHLGLDKQLVIAHKRSDVEEINNLIREKLEKSNQFYIDKKAFGFFDRIIFDRNSNFVKNGTFGTIMSIEETKKGHANIVVQLDEGRAIKFNTIQYNTFSHGYAVTVHKAQGATVDRVYGIASSSQTAQLTHVMFTRHKTDFELYVDRETFRDIFQLEASLSKIEQKDLVIDYSITAENKEYWDNIANFIEKKENVSIVLENASHQSEEQNKEIWEVSNWKEYQQLKSETQELAKEIIENWQAHELYAQQAGYDLEKMQIEAGIIAKPLTAKEHKAKLNVELYAEARNETRNLWNEIKKTHPGSASKLHAEYEKFYELRIERNSLANEIASNIRLHSKFFKENEVNKQVILNHAEAHQEAQAQKIKINKLSETEKASANNWNTKYQEYEQVCAKASNAWAKAQQEASEKNINVWKTANITEWKNLKEQRTFLATELLPEAKKWGEEVQLKNIERYAKQEAGINKQNPEQWHKAWEDINKKLDLKMEDLAFSLLGKPQYQKRDELRYGHKGSLVIGISGIKAGKFYDHEKGEGGGAFKLIERELGLKGKEAFTWAKDFLGERALITEKTYQSAPKNEQFKEQQLSEWKPIFPIPKSVQQPDLNSEQLKKMMWKWQEVDRYAYKNQAGQLLGYVVRLEEKHPEPGTSISKITPPLTYCENSKGEKQWMWKGFGENRPLFGAEKLNERFNSPILIVEGEKTAIAAQKLLPEYCVISWMGGAASVAKSDWSVLKNRDITIWPDNDVTGKLAAENIKTILEHQNRIPKQLDIVKLPEHFPNKWDLADKIPDKTNIRDLIEFKQQTEYPLAGKNYKEMTEILEKQLNKSFSKQSEHYAQAKAIAADVVIWRELNHSEPSVKEQDIIYTRIKFEEERSREIIKELVHKNPNEEMHMAKLHADRLATIESRKLAEAFTNNEKPNLAVIAKEAIKEIERHDAQLQEFSIEASKNLHLTEAEGKNFAFQAMLLLERHGNSVMNSIIQENDSKLADAIIETAVNQVDKSQEDFKEPKLENVEFASENSRQAAYMLSRDEMQEMRICHLEKSELTQEDIATIQTQCAEKYSEEIRSELENIKNEINQEKEMLSIQQETQKSRGLELTR